LSEFPYDRHILEAIERAFPAIHQHLLDGLPEEVVGLVLSDGATVRLINQARSDSRFEVGVPQLAQALADINPETHTVIGIYHSHPQGSLNLSTHDQKNMKTQWSVGFSLPWIVMVDDFRASIWWLDPIYKQPVRYLVEPAVA
jgi:proteasome lid subunit RPN8/RPN11